MQRTNIVKSGTVSRWAGVLITNICQPRNRKGVGAALSTDNNMKHYSNIIVSKLREYSRSYGGKEAVGHAYGIETDKEWLFFNDKGSHARTMRKGSKLLINVIGDPMPEDAFHKKMQELENAREQVFKLRHS